MRLPQDHPQRFELNDEVHARPPEALTAPLRLSYVALLAEPGRRGQDWQHVHDLAQQFGTAPPAVGANHFSADLGPFRLRWERHTEFARYKFIVAGAGDDPFAEPAVSAVPAEWLGALPGRVIVAAHAALVVADDSQTDHEAVAARLFAGNMLIGASIANGAATALTDFRIREDGFSRLLVQDRKLAPRQAGRMIQRLLEIDSYRVMALLALPLAREMAPVLNDWQQELAEVTDALAHAQEKDEPGLLDRLTRLEAEIESRASASHYRFSAAAAYYDLVRQRIAELREERIEGLQTFREFTERRLAPAMNTCKGVAQLRESLSERVARATQLLSTRVEIAREVQTQAVLQSMNRRAELQLRLQETVEGLSIAAVTYYIVGLVSYATKGLNALGARLEPELVTGVSIPVVIILVALGVRQIRKTVRHATAT